MTDPADQIPDPFLGNAPVPRMICPRCRSPMGGLRFGSDAEEAMTVWRRCSNRECTYRERVED